MRWLGALLLIFLVAAAVGYGFGHLTLDSMFSDYDLEINLDLLRVFAGEVLATAKSTSEDPADKEDESGSPDEEAGSEDVLSISPLRLFGVQVGAFRERTGAEKLSEQMAEDGYFSYIREEGRYHKVFAALCGSAETADRVCGALQKSGRECFVTSTTVPAESMTFKISAAEYGNRLWSLLKDALAQVLDRSTIQLLEGTKTDLSSDLLAELGAGIDAGPTEVPEVLSTLRGTGSQLVSLAEEQTSPESTMERVLSLLSDLERTFRELSP